MKQIMNGADLRRMIISAAANIEIHKQQLNDLNVFPVPDGDTGTNMSMTINALGASIIEQVSYWVTHHTGTEVRAVNVYVDSMMIG